MQYTVKLGTLVYIDSFCGLVPAKIIKVHSPNEVTVRTTAERPGWRRGEVMRYILGSGTLVPRTAVRVRNGHRVIRTWPVVAEVPPTGGTP